MNSMSSSLYLTHPTVDTVDFLVVGVGVVVVVVVVVAAAVEAFVVLAATAAVELELVVVAVCFVGVGWVAAAVVVELFSVVGVGCSGWLAGEGSSDFLLKIL